MAVYPLQIPRFPYRGHNPARLRKAERFNALAERLEQHINSQVEKSNDRTQFFSYGGIARDLRIDEKEVENVLYGVEAGGNAITIVRASRSTGAQSRGAKG
jgi:hypothetical protein